MESEITAELRWFFPDCPGEEIVAAFEALEPAAEEARTDSYVRFDAAPTVGIKRRQGSVEAKALVRPGVAETLLSGTIQGVEEWWEKHLLAEALVGSPDQDWIDVKKSRLLVCDPDRHCNAEITRLLVGDRRFWTLGFEASGPTSDLSERLLAVAEETLAKTVPRKRRELFCLAWSMSYPQWLLSLDSGSMGAKRSGPDNRSAG